MNQNKNFKKLYFFIWFLNLGCSLGLGQALCSYLAWPTVMRLLPIGFGIILSIMLTFVAKKEIKPLRVLPLAFVQCIYWSVALYAMAYQNIYECSPSISFFNKYRLVTVVMSIIIWLSIVLGIVLLRRAYEELKNKVHFTEGDAFNNLYYQLVLPKAILVGVGGCVAYIIATITMSKRLFYEIEGKRFCFAMMYVASGAICFGFALGIMWGLRKVNGTKEEK